MKDTVKRGLSILAAILLPAISLSAGDTLAANTKQPDTHGLPAGFHDLQIGESAPDFELPGIDGKTHRLADYNEAKVLVIIFLSNHCPDSHAAEARVIKLVSDMKGRSFVLLAINPNNPEALSPEELGYTIYNDGFDDMKKYAPEAGFNFPYLYDGEKQAVAKAYGCLATPNGRVDSDELRSKALDFMGKCCRD
jgi:peroxiredoxin